VAAIPYSQVCKGMVIVVEGRLVAVHGDLSVCPDEGTLTPRLRDLETGTVTQRRVHAEEPAVPAQLRRREMQYIYQDGDGYVFLDADTFQQTTLRREWVGDLMSYIKEAQRVPVVFHDGQPLSLEVPPTVNLAIVDAEPISAAQQRALLETGLRLPLPRSIGVGETVTIDTRREAYVGRSVTMSSSLSSQ
jgi:elongation factor P